MALFPWRTDAGDNIQDDTPQDIIFKKTDAQVNVNVTVGASAKAIIPAGTVGINVSFNVEPTPILRRFAAARIINSWFINTTANSRVNRWAAIMFKYIGSREV